MKSFIRFSWINFIFLFISFYSCKEKSNPPIVATTDISAISYTNAASGGVVNDEGSDPVASRGVCWNTTPKPTITDNKTSDGNGLGTFSSSITQLNPNVVYYVRAYAISSSGTAYGDQVSFSTLKVGLPVLTTTEVTSISQTSSSSGGNITDDKGGSVTARGVCWSINQNPTISDSKTTDGSGSGVFTSSLTGLTANTTYNVRAYATNSEGTEYGNQFSFKTDPGLPAVTTTAIVTPVNSVSFKSGGDINNDGGSIITSRGVCYSTSPNPSLTDSKTIDGQGSGPFVSSLTNLTPNTKYYIRAYASNSIGTSYGAEVSFTTDPATVADADGNIYNVLRYGTELWITENLRTTKYSNGDLIETTSPAEKDISAEAAPKYQWIYPSIVDKVETYGRLYTWYAANDARNICPVGWHLPTSAEWSTFGVFLTNNGYGYGGSGDGIGKSIASNHDWFDYSTVPGSIGNDEGSNNSSGFNGLPSGSRDATISTAPFVGYRNWLVWLSSTETNATQAVGRHLYYCCMPQFDYIETLSKNFGYSVRCLRNN